MSVSNVGPCGMETYDELQTNWNHPEHSWGYDVVATYNSGDVITVEWCVSNIADHGEPNLLLMHQSLTNMHIYIFRRNVFL